MKPHELARYLRGKCWHLPKHDITFKVSFNARHEPTILFWAVDDWQESFTYQSLEDFLKQEAVQVKAPDK